MKMKRGEFIFFISLYLFLIVVYVTSLYYLQHNVVEIPFCGDSPVFPCKMGSTPVIYELFRITPIVLSTPAFLFIQAIGQSEEIVLFLNIFIFVVYAFLITKGVLFLRKNYFRLPLNIKQRRIFIVIVSSLFILVAGTALFPPQHLYLGCGDLPAFGDTCPPGPSFIHLLMNALGIWFQVPVVMVLSLLFVFIKLPTVLMSTLFLVLLIIYAITISYCIAKIFYRKRS